MSSYRLLRSNKETGPYSQEEMIVMGFKPYDLIWVEGKSAGWRYPSEIPELKAYAPVIEEQPYDRFYKKPVVPARGTPLPQNIIEPALRPEPAVASVYAPVSAPVAAAVPVAAETSRPAFSPATASVGRHIHVTLPSGNTLNVTTLSGRATAVQEKSVQLVPEEKQPGFAATLSAQPLFAPVAETVPARKTAMAAEPESAVVSNTYFPAASTAAAGFSWTTVVGMVVGIATLVGLGIMIGLSINHRKPELAGVKENSLAQPATPVVRQTSSPAEHTPVDNTISNTNIPVSSTGSITRPVKPPVPSSQQQAAVTGKKDAGGSQAKAVPATKKVVKLPENKPAEKPSTDLAVREPAVVRPKASEAVQVVNIEKQVNVHTNGYKVGAFGGISDLQCTLVNDSKYALESVEVELQYIQANDKVFKTEKLSFRDVGAGAQITLNAPKSPRGIKIIGRVVKINAREPGLAAITIKS